MYKNFYRRNTRMEWWYKTKKWTQLGYLPNHTYIAALANAPQQQVSQNYQQLQSVISSIFKKLDINEKDQVVKEQVRTFAQKQLRLMKQGMTEQKAFEKVRSQMRMKFIKISQDIDPVKSSAVSYNDYFHQTAQYEALLKVWQLQRDIPKFARTLTPELAALDSYESVFHKINQRSRPTEPEVIQNFSQQTQALLSYNKELDPLRGLSDQEILQSTKTLNKQTKEALGDLSKLGVHLDHEGNVVIPPNVGVDQVQTALQQNEKVQDAMQKDQVKLKSGLGTTVVFSNPNPFKANFAEAEIETQEDRQKRLDQVWNNRSTDPATQVNLQKQVHDKINKIKAKLSRPTIDIDKMTAFLSLDQTQLSQQDKAERTYIYDQMVRPKPIYEDSHAVNDYQRFQEDLQMHVEETTKEDALRRISYLSKEISLDLGDQTLEDIPIEKLQTTKKMNSSSKIQKVLSKMIKK